MNTTPNIDSKYRAPALEKGLDILELLSASDSALSMPMIAAELNRSKGEIFRMATVLENRGYIRRVESSDRFVVTNRLFELGMQNPPIRNLIEIASPLMHELAISVDQSCHLAVASGDQIVVIYGTEATGYVSFAVRIGHRLPLLQSASGRTLLAFQASNIQEEWLEYEPMPSKRAAIRKRVTIIQNRGCEQAVSEVVNGILDISAPVFDGKSSGAIASLTMPLMKHLKLKKEQQAAVDAVRATATEISAQLSIGYDTNRAFGR